MICDNMGKYTWKIGGQRQEWDGNEGEMWGRIPVLPPPWRAPAVGLVEPLV